MPVPIPSKEIESKISKSVQQAHSKLRESRRLYEEAEHQLLTEFDLLNIDLSPTSVYERAYSRTVRASRLDAEYFQSKYYKVMEKLQKAAKVRKASTISSFSPQLKYGTSDKLTYTERGVPFLRIADLENRRFDPATVLRISPNEAKEQKTAQARSGDVLVSRSGTLGVAITVPDDLNGAIFGSYFIRIRPDASQIYPEYLALFINSLCGSLQVQRLTTGAVQTNLTIPAIKSLYVVSGDLKWQEEFIRRTELAVHALKESKRLLEDAKKMVEESVRQGGH